MLHTHKANLLTFLLYYNYSHKNNQLYMKRGKIYFLDGILLSHPNFLFLSEES